MPQKCRTTTVAMPWKNLLRGPVPELVAESRKGHVTSNSSRCVTEVMFATSTEIANKEKEEMGWAWIFTTDGHILQAMWQGGVSGPLGIKEARTELLEQLHKAAVSLWRSNGTDSNNWRVYRFWLPLKHRSQKQMILPVAAFSISPLQNFHPLAFGH